jgi:hypothetical protein
MDGFGGVFTFNESLVIGLSYGHSQTGRNFSATNPGHRVFISILRVPVANTRAPRPK